MSWADPERNITVALLNSGKPIVSAHVLRLAESASEPGTVEHLPFRWHQEPDETKWHPAEPSPIIAWLKQRQRAKSS